MITRKYLSLLAVLLLVSHLGPRLEAGPRSISGVDSTGRLLPPRASSQQQYSDQPQRATEKAEARKPRQKTRHLSRAETQNRIKQLIALSEKAALEIRNEINTVRAQKGKHRQDADVKAALDMAVKFDRYALMLRQNEKSLAGGGSNSEATYQTMLDMSQQLQLQLQDAMNRQQQAMQMLSNIMKNQHDTLKGIIRNMR